MSSDGFDWAPEQIIIPRQSAVALYINGNDEVVIRQECQKDDCWDETIVLSRQSAAILANKINELLVSDNFDVKLMNKTAPPSVSPKEIREHWKERANKELEEAKPQERYAELSITEPEISPKEANKEPDKGPPSSSDIVGDLNKNWLEMNRESEQERIDKEVLAYNAKSRLIAEDKNLREAVSFYNATAKLIGLPICQKLTQRRKASLKARLQECGGLSGWAQALEKLVDSPHCRGENERGWVADFDFVVQEKSFQKLIEGSYARHVAKESMDYGIFRSRAPVVKPEPDRRGLKTEEERRAFIEAAIRRREEEPDPSLEVGGNGQHG